MLRLRAFRQSEGFCGPASLKMVLGYFGVEKSEKALARLAGSTRAFGTPAKGLVKAAQDLGFKASVRDEAEFSDLDRMLKKNIPVIVNWFSTQEGHYSVAIRLTAKKIWLLDPETGTIQDFSRTVFRQIWFDFEAQKPYSKETLILRRMIVVEPSKTTSPSRKAAASRRGRKAR